MTSDGEKPMHKQFLRVQREDEEETWISGEELKTEGSSGSDDDVPRRKISPRKSRRRRSEGYTPPEARLSLPNLSENKMGIAFKLSRPMEGEDMVELRGERFSYSGEQKPLKEDRSDIEAAMARMRTRSSLDKTCELDESADSESGWRPKRASTSTKNLEIMKQKSESKVCPSLPKLDGKKSLRFSEDVEEFSASEDVQIHVGDRNFEFEAFGHSFSEDEQGTFGGKEYHMMKFRGAGDLHSETSSMEISGSQDNYDIFNNGDIDRELMGNLEGGSGGWNRGSKKKLHLPISEDGNIDLSVKNFVSEMNEFYNEMSGRLKSLKNCPVLEDSDQIHMEPSDEKFIKEKNFKNLYKNLKKTPQMKKTLSVISKMDSDISETITKFREERAERLEFQRQLMKDIPRDKDSQLFLSLCDFEANSKETRKDLSSSNRSRDNERMRTSRRVMEDKNFIERNIELAKLGMNFSLSDEQKQRLERILKDNECIDDDHGERLNSGIRRANKMPDANISYNPQEDIYQHCTLNAYRLSDDHKGRLIEIDSALQAFDDGSVKSSETTIGIDLVRSLKEIDEKLDALSASYRNGEELLQLNKRKPSELDIDKMEEQLIQGDGEKIGSEASSHKDLSFE